VVTVFALVSAVLYGSADFLGGAATRRAHVLSVLVLSSVAGLVIAVVAAVGSGEPFAAAGLGWGLGAGVVGGLGLIVFYSGLAAGPMSVVAPVSALVSTILPVGIALAQGERPGPAVYAGGALCLTAIVLVSSGSATSSGSGSGSDSDSDSDCDSGGGGGGVGRSGGGGRRRGRAVGYGVAAGASFGVFFVFMRSGGQSGALWPVTAARLGGLGVIMTAAVVIRAAPLSWRPARGPFAAAIGSGVLDSSANISYVLATRAGLFGLAVVLAALYPGVTVLLARLLLGERLRWAQRAGLGIAAVGIVLVAG